MGKLRLCINNNPVLRKKGQKVSSFGSAEQLLFESMIETMHLEKGIGLAAPQVGISRKMLVIDVGDGPIKLANPCIVKKSGIAVMEEGCLSLPEIVVNIKRAVEVIVTGQDESGQAVTIEASDFLARALQHEIDHLDGKLIVDYLPWFKRWKIKIKIAKNPV